MAHARRLAVLVVAVALAGCGASGGSAGSDADAAANGGSGGIANGGSGDDTTEPAPDASSASDTPTDGSSRDASLDARAPSDASARTDDAATIADGAASKGNADADAATPPSLDGCWVTHTDSGETTLQISLANPSSDTESFDDDAYAMTSVSYNGTDFHYQVDFSFAGGSICHIDFTATSPALMTGTSNCVGNIQTISADRTCS